MTWQDKSLAECAVFRSGGTPNKGRPEFWGGDIPWVSSGEMTRQFITDTSLHVTEAGAASGSRLVPSGTMFVVVRGMSLAKEFRVSYAIREMAFNQDLKALTAKQGIDPYFLFTALRAHAPAIQELATEAAHGTKKLEMERLQSFSIRVPDLDTQVRIAAEARNLDDLIENNQRRIALLEESARLMGREWFAGLRFPCADGHENVASVPRGWAMGTVDELASFVSRGITPRYDDGATGLVINQKCIRGGRLNLGPARRQSKEVKADRLLKVGDVLINSTGAGTLGRVAQIRTHLQDCTVDTHVTIVRPVNQKAAAYLGVALLEKEPLLSTMGVGSTNQLELPRSDVSALPLVIPPKEIQEAFHELVWPMFTQAESLALANEKLKEARDALLPKLMSGELRV
jgi:type I restriction enzyme S subunit